jgi:hypothetical protein
MRRFNPLVSIFGLGAWLAVSAANAQSYPCDQSMITGSWIFADSNTGFACLIAISSTGSISSTASNCAINPTRDIITPMTGHLLINRTCKLTGQITYSTSESGNPPITISSSNNLTLYRSLDGSRLTGYTLQTIVYSCTNCGTDYSLIPAELTLIPQPPPPP